MKVCIDPGHGGSDRANRGPGGYIEADGNLKIALAVAEYLQPYPIDIVWTRVTADATVSLSERCRIANDAKADIFVSIHSNATELPAARGTETYHSINSTPGHGGNLLATLIHANVVRLAGTKNRGVRTRQGADGKDYYAVIRETEMPAVIVEVAYHSNPEDEALLRDVGFRLRAARGIAKGIIEYAGLEWRDPEAVELRRRLEQIKTLVEDYSYQKQ